MFENFSEGAINHDELRDFMRKKIEQEVPNFYENWHPNLRKSFFLKDLHREIRLSVEDMKELVAVAYGEPLKRNMNHLFDDIPVSWFLPGVFVKLSTRSPKDYMANVVDGRPQPIRTIEGILDALSLSMRTCDDMSEFITADMECRLHITPYIYDMKQDEEWRSFIYEGRLVGITQYYYGVTLGEPAREYAEKAIRLITERVSELKSFAPADSIVMDFWVQREGVKAHLIEINTFGLSDPCLLSHNDMMSVKDGSVLVAYNLMNKIKTLIPL